MMTITEQVLLSLALAIDCFTVSLTFGAIRHRFDTKLIFSSSFLFGLFQAGMPFIGWLAINLFSEKIEKFDHWIAFGLLLFIGGKMIIENLPCQKKNDKERKETNISAALILIMAVATSIDALAIGPTLSCTGFKTMAELVCPLTIIAAGSFILSVIGNIIGIEIGSKINFPIEPVGGAILILLGIKILLF